MPKQSQIQKFRDKAREIGADVSEERFRSIMEILERHKPSPESKASTKRTSRRKKR